MKELARPGISWKTVRALADTANHVKRGKRRDPGSGPGTKFLSLSFGFIVLRFRPERVLVVYFRSTFSIVNPYNNFLIQHADIFFQQIRGTVAGIFFHDYFNCCFR